MAFNAKQVFAGLKKMKVQARKAHGRCLKKAVMTTIEREAKKVWPTGHPGTPVDTSTLRRSLHTEEVKGSRHTAEVLLGTNIEYAYFVHEGHKTRSGGFVEGRPYLFGPMEHKFKNCLEAYAKCMREEFGL